jgi:predicted nucleic acid-binding protein
MPDKKFLDTNILLYSYSEDEADKQSVALQLLEEYDADVIISKQVINELTNILFKKFKLSSNEVENVLLELDTVIPIVDFDISTQIKAVRIKDKYNLQFYDSLIIATALENKCTILYSEDMQHNQIIDGKLTIINPFKAN